MTTPALLVAFAQQAAWCDSAAPFTARVLRASQAWLAGQPAVAAELAGIAANPLAAAVPLRWVGGLHWLALQGLAPWASLWPPAGGQADEASLHAAIALAWHTQQPLMQQALSRPPQTNEAQRSAALLPGLLHIAAQTGLPLALLEIGASAGLNLWCDRYRLAPVQPAGGADPAPAGPAGWAWGRAEAPVLLQPEWTGPPPPGADAGLGAGTPLNVASRAACDAHPVDLRQPAEALRLASFVWPDQAERLARLRAAQQAVAGWLQAEGVQVQALSAAAFVQRELARPRPGQVTVLMHSVVWQYIDAAEQAAIEQTLQQAAARADARAPLAWLRLEPQAATGAVELRCQQWPGGSERVLAESHPHAARIHWRGSA